MSNHIRLDNVAHRDLHIILERSAQYGDNIACIGVFPIEFRRLQAQYPIVFRKNGTTDQYEPIALFGFEEGENLFLGEDGWMARYIPLSIERQPFLIGFDEATENGVPVQVPVVHIDADSPRISDEEGEPVFLEHGGNSPFLEHINAVLATIHDGHTYNKGFSEALETWQLLEPFTVDVVLKDGSKHKLAGFHTINEKSLQALDAEALAQMHAAGYLEHIYMAMASLANFAPLIDRKNALLEQSG